MTVRRRRCTTCHRSIIAQGPARIIEAARTLEGAEPAEEYIAKLENSRRKTDLDRLAVVVIVLEEYARLGRLRIPLELNQLRDDLWEIKAGVIRLPFYEPNDSSHVSVVTRLTSGFVKKQRNTPQGEIRRGIWVMGQDRQQI